MRADPSVRRFRVTTKPKPNRPNQWDSTVVTIYDGDAEIGSYERHYYRFGEETFEPFELDGSWYALYSKDYTCTRIMTLPDCRDIGGENPESNGFCPVELFVPRYRERRWTKIGDPKYDRLWRKFEAEAYALVESEKEIGDGILETIGPWRTLDLAFVAGCIWGDDSSWKLQMFDLSRVADGVLQRSERFGFLELGTMPLAKAVQCHRSDSQPLRATIIRQEERDLRSGVFIHPYD